MQFLKLTIALTYSFVLIQSIPAKETNAEDFFDHPLKTTEELDKEVTKEVSIEEFFYPDNKISEEIIEPVFEDSASMDDITNFFSEFWPTALGHWMFEKDSENGFEITDLQLTKLLYSIKQIEESPFEPTYDVPIVMNKSVSKYIDFFHIKMKKRFSMWLKRSELYLAQMKEIFKKHDLPQDLVFVGLIESGFSTRARSSANAMGPWQFMKPTGRRYGLKINQWVDERKDPIKSTDAAARYLKDLYEMFGSWPLALASYNAGEGRIGRAMKRSNQSDFWALRSTRHIRRETKDYVPKFMAATIIAKNPTLYGFPIIEEGPLQYEEINVTKQTRLKDMARLVNCSHEELRDLNPEIKRDITPPEKNYLLKIPKGTKEIYLAKLDTNNFTADEEEETSPSEEKKEPVKKKSKWYRVRRGETLTQIARKFATKIETLQEINDIEDTSLIHAGKLIKIK